MVPSIDDFALRTISDGKGFGVSAAGEITGYDKYNLKALRKSGERGKSYDLARINGAPGNLYVIEYKCWRTSLEAAQLAALHNELYESQP